MVISLRKYDINICEKYVKSDRVERNRFSFNVINPSKQEKYILFLIIYLLSLFIEYFIRYVHTLVDNCLIQLNFTAQINFINN